MITLDSISFTQGEDTISAVILDRSFCGYELIYDEALDKIVEAYSVDATGSRAVHSVVSLDDVPTYLLIKVKKFIHLNYEIKCPVLHTPTRNSTSDHA